MYRNDVPPGGWNLFARTLQEILALHRIRLSQLDDPPVSLHKEKVRRLQKSLRENPPCFPMLTPNELERTIAAYGLNEQEHLRLRAAVLAAAIQNTLVDRINQYDALAAAEEILPILERVLQANVHRTVGIGAVKGDKNILRDESECSDPFETALKTIDLASLTLALCCNVKNRAKRAELLRHAQLGFERVLAHLEGVAEEVRQKDEWTLWREEAAHNLMDIVGQLALLERDSGEH